MDNQMPKIVVVTPVKNEAWILERFLAVTSQFADHIIIADQNSTDDSVAICKKYSKVVLIQNKSEQFNEADRQMLLLQVARDLVPEHKIILALDADEILAANATKALGWQTMLQAKPGTILYFEKPDLFQTTNQCIRYDVPFPIGYVDDGAAHTPKKIHSPRIPMPDAAMRLHIHDVKILHYATARLSGQTSKTRLYTVLENILDEKSMFLKRLYSVASRRIVYASNRDWKSNGKLELCNEEWFKEWEKIGIDMHTICCDRYYWYDFEVLKHFATYGTHRFWLEDIWSFNWESCRLYANDQQVENIPDYPISPPPKLIRALMKILDRIYLSIKNMLKK